MALDTNDVSRHRLPVAWLSALSAGTGSPEITRYLWTTERSRRLLVISTLLAAGEQTPRLAGPLPPVAEVWDILAAAQSAHPSAFDDLLLHPQVGSWAAYALRRQRGGAASELPMWVDFGGAHVLALVAAARAKLPWRTRVPVRGRYLMLPTLGMARFTGLTADVVHAETDGGQILLTHGQQEIVVTESLADAESWWNLRRLHVGHELPLTVWLDDIDPFRDLADPVPPARLDQAAFDRWSGLIADAWAMLCRDHREDAEAMAGGVVSLVPLVPEPGWGTRSASNGEAFGSVMVSEPPDAVTLAEALVHEFQHIKLGALMHLVPLTDQDDGERYYAPWRDDPRPLGGLLQGVYAFFGIAGFWRNHRRTVEGPAAAVADYEYACTRAQTDEALRSVLGAPALTHEGRMFVEGLQARLAAWLAEPLPDEVARLAALTADSHRTGWRLRHVRPDAHAVRALAKAWEESHSAEPVPDGPVEPHPNLRWPQRIPALARRRIKAMAGDDRAAPAPGTGLTAADEALVSGDVDQALASYLASLPATAESDDDAVRAWVGLSLSHAGAAKAPSASALSTRPELVRAVHSELAAAGLDADPLALGGWLAPG